MTMLDRIKRRLAKEDAEQEAYEAAAAPRREERYKKIDELLAEYDRECQREPYTISDDACRTFNHVTDEYGHDLVFFFRRIRAGKQP